MPKKNDRSEKAPAPRQHRRRRSAMHVPALVTPVDFPDDAPGRVEFISVHAPNDEQNVNANVSPVEPPIHHSTTITTLVQWQRGWGGVAVVGAVIAGGFWVGMQLIR